MSVARLSRTRTDSYSQGLDQLLERYPGLLTDEDYGLVLRRWERKEQQDPKGGWGLRHRLRKVQNALDMKFGTSLNNQVTKALRAGCPASYRSELWWVASGAREKAAEAFPDEAYEAVLARGTSTLPEKVRHQIEIDLRRTGTGEEIKQDTCLAKLRRILTAYATRNPRIGYCQSMNFIAALLLLQLPEERAFWVLAALLEDLLPMDFYTTDMLGARVELKVFERVVEIHCRHISRHLQAIDASLEACCYPWFLCLFANTLPYEPTLRAFDVILHEGPKVILRLALALLKLQEPQLLAASDVGDVYMALRFPFGAEGGALGRQDDTSTWTADDLIYMAFDHRNVAGFPNDVIKALRQEVTAELRASVDDQDNSVMGRIRTETVQFASDEVVADDDMVLSPSGRRAPRAPTFTLDDFLTTPMQQEEPSASVDDEAHTAPQTAQLADATPHEDRSAEDQSPEVQLRDDPDQDGVGHSLGRNTERRASLLQILGQGHDYEAFVNAGRAHDRTAHNHREGSLPAIYSFAVSEADEASFRSASVKPCERLDEFISFGTPCQEAAFDDMSSRTGSDPGSS